MSDHIDGPRQMGDPSADLTDLFAFTSPENAARTVLAVCVFPSAGTTAMFSNAVDYAFAMRRVTVAGLGDAAKFEPGEEEIRLSCRFDNLKRGTAGRVLDPGRGSLFGVIAETVPLKPNVIGLKPPRIDWVGRPEQTNIRLGNSEAGPVDLRDLWNQQTPFAIAADLKPVFRERLTASLANWDMRDGVADWTPAALAANANVFLDDFLLFDVAKPMTDT